MKKQFLNLLGAQMANLKRQRMNNSLEEAEKMILDEAIAELQKIIDEASAVEDDVTALDALKEMMDEIGKRVKAIEEKAAAAGPEPQPVENWLKSNDAVKAFANALRSSVRNRSDFGAEWSREAMANGITFDPSESEVIYPEVVKSRITDLWNADTNWLNKLHNTRAKVYGVRVNESDQDNKDNRAKGHKKGDLKAEQEITITSFKIEAQMIYKQIPVDKITEFNDDGALVEYVVDELFRQWQYEIGRAILVGDGRQASDIDKITSFTEIARTNGDAFVSVQTRSSGELVDDIVNMLSTIEHPDEVLLFISKGDLNTLRRHIYGTGGTPTYASRQTLAEELGVGEIITSKLVGGNNNYQAIAFCPSLYATVGEMVTPRYETYYDFMHNRTYYRQEAPVGGAPEALGMGAVLKAQ